MNVIQKIKELDLPEGSFAVTGSGVMDVLGIREAKDVDLVVSPEVYEKLKQDGWEEELHSDGRTTLKKDIYEVMLNWDEEDNLPNLEDLLEGARVIDGVPFVSIERLMKWKKRKGRDKDLTDIELIKDYLEKST